MACVDFTNAKTSVFWDMVDFPMSPLCFCEKIKLALKAQGYSGEVLSVEAYGEKKPKELNLYDSVFNFVSEREKNRRLEKMILDIGWWAVDHPEPVFNPTNLMVIAQNVEEETHFASLLESLSTLGYNVLFVLPPEFDPKKVQVPEVNKIWYWGGLIAGDKAAFYSHGAYKLSKEFLIGAADEEEEEEDNTPCTFCSEGGTVIAHARYL